MNLPRNNYDISHDEIRNLLNLPRLSARRDFIDLTFLYKIVNGLINSPEILNRINLAVSQINLRNNELFYIEYHRTNYGLNTSLQRLCRLGNSVALFYPLLRHLFK